ncbi:MAG: energy transducer TonB [Gammaproteobacteria bacterium]|nr:energy transducer TonB [Gammaproteobacteria bacterium]
MTIRSVLVAAAALAATTLFTNSPARAELLCDCTQVVDSCSAGVSLNGTRVNIESSNDSCSRVDYLIEGQPFTALIVGGSDELRWPGQPIRDAAIVVENCRVCAETGAEEVSPFAAADDSETGDDDESADDSADDSLRSLIKIMPQYPRRAWMQKMEGDVLVEFSVNQQGVVQNIKVISSSNRIFDVPTLDAVSRFRYEPAEENGQPTVTTGVRERFYFRLQGTAGQPSVTSAAG